MSATNQLQNNTRSINKLYKYQSLNHITLLKLNKYTSRFICALFTIHEGERRLPLFWALVLYNKFYISSLPSHTNTLNLCSSRRVCRIQVATLWTWTHISQPRLVDQNGHHNQATVSPAEKHCCKKDSICVSVSLPMIDNCRE